MSSKQPLVDGSIFHQTNPEGKMQDKVVVLAERAAVPVGSAFPSHTHVCVYIKREQQNIPARLVTISIPIRQTFRTELASKRLSSEWRDSDFRSTVRPSFTGDNCPRQPKSYTIDTAPSVWPELNHPLVEANKIFQPFFFLGRKRKGKKEDRNWPAN